MDKDVQALILAAPTAIASEEDAGYASEHLAKLRKVRKAFEEKFDGLKKPFNEGLRALNTEFKETVEPLREAEAKISQGILAWRNAVAQEAARVKAEADRKQAEYDRQAREAEAANKPAPTPPPQLPAQATEGPGRGFITAAGVVTARKVPKWRLRDASQVPWEVVIDGIGLHCWLLNEVEIGKLCRNRGGKDSPIPGIEFYTEETLGVR